MFTLCFCCFPIVGLFVKVFSEVAMLCANWVLLATGEVKNLVRLTAKNLSLVKAVSAIPTVQNVIENRVEDLTLSLLRNTHSETLDRRGRRI